MKKKKIIKIIGICSALVLVLSFFVKDKDKKPLPDLTGNFIEQKSELVFASQPSETVKISEGSVSAMHSMLDKVQAEYKYADLYDLPEVKKRLSFSAAVDKHSSNKLNKESLNAEYLSELIFENNKKYLAEADTFKYEEAEPEYIKEICGLIVRIVNIMQDKYPDLDWDRVWCNLSNLKIFNEAGMLSYAQIKSDIILSVSSNNVTIAELKFGDTGYRDILVHEIMHIIQIGCLCENIENCERRAGISVNWSDFPLNTTDWTWLIEGSAERVACGITGAGAISYQYKMDYLCSYNLSVLLRESVYPDTIETLSFKNDPQLLFDAFGCSNQRQREEILKMIISTEILQSQPTRFYEVCKEKTGYDPSRTDEELNRFGYYLKSDICISLAKEFYENLADFVYNNEVSHNDLFFLINIFEGHLNQHLKFNKKSQKEFNLEFLKQYNLIRDEFFTLLTADNSHTDFAAMYNEYNILADGDETLNADLTVLSQEKRDFLIERAQWQKDNMGLGEKAAQVSAE